MENLDFHDVSDEQIQSTDLFRQWKTQLECSDDSYRLAIGAVLARRMREAVYEKCGFTCSAGIGPNKVCILTIDIM